MTDAVTVTEQTAFAPELREAFDRLVPQLSSSNPPPTDAQVTDWIAQAKRLHEEKYGEKL